MPAPRRAYRSLDGELIVATIERLHRRITERFPGSGLSKVCAELHAIAQDSKERCEWIARPNYGLRAGVAAFVSLTGIGMFIGVGQLELSDGRFGLWEFAQTFETSINNLILLGAAMIFLVTAESRIKRARAVRALNGLRAITHVIDAHQLTKDPVILFSRSPTKSSPERSIDQQQLNRYLDYCSEMLALTGKVTALYAQELPDPVVVSIVTDIEGLAVGLSGKIWQKISLLDRGVR